MYENTSGYGGLAGFSGPALGDGSPVEVVRFQDLHRRHAPASAGLPEVAHMPSPGATFGDVMASPDFGGFAFGTVPSYGDMGYGRPIPVTDTGGYAYSVETGSPPYKVTITKAPSGSVPRDVPPGTAAYDAIMLKAKAQYPADFLPDAPASSPSSSSTDATSAAPSTEREKAEKADWTKSKSAQGGKDFVTGLLEGYQTVRTRESDIAKQKIAADVKPPEEENKALTYALWAGGALLGLGAVVLIVKAVSGDHDDKKKGE